LRTNGSAVCKTPNLFVISLCNAGCVQIAVRVQTVSAP